MQIYITDVNYTKREPKHLEGNAVINILLNVCEDTARAQIIKQQVHFKRTSGQVDIVERAGAIYWDGDDSSDSTNLGVSVQLKTAIALNTYLMFENPP